MPALAADLMGRHVAVIFAGGGNDPARAAKAATTTVPIIFVSATDPVATGLVASLNRPGGNVTGVSLIGSALEAKRLELLHGLVPKASTIAVLLNPNYAAVKSQSEEVEAAAAHLGVSCVVLTVSTEHDLDPGFAAMVQKRADALSLAKIRSSTACEINWWPLRRAVICPPCTFKDPSWRMEA